MNVVGLMVLMFCLVAIQHEWPHHSTWRFICPRMPRSVCIYSGAYTEQLPASNSTANYNHSVQHPVCRCWLFLQSSFSLKNETILTGWMHRTTEFAINKDHAMWTWLGQTDVVCHIRHNSQGHVYYSRILLRSNLIKVSDDVSYSMMGTARNIRRRSIWGSFQLVRSRLQQNK